MQHMDMFNATFPQAAAWIAGSWTQRAGSNRFWLMFGETLAGFLGVGSWEYTQQCSFHGHEFSACSMWKNVMPGPTKSGRCPLHEINQSRACWFGKVCIEWLSDKWRYGFIYFFFLNVALSIFCKISHILEPHHFGGLEKCLCFSTKRGPGLPVLLLSYLPHDEGRDWSGPRPRLMASLGWKARFKRDDILTYSIRIR